MLNLDNLWVPYPLRLIQFNIIVLLALIHTKLEENFPKEYISEFLVCTESCAQPYIMKMVILPDHLARGEGWGGALVWVPETTSGRLHTKFQKDLAKQTDGQTDGWTGLKS